MSDQQIVFDDGATYDRYLGRWSRIVGDVFLDTTLRNVAANSRIAVSACDPATMEGYQVKGRAVYVTEGPIVETFKKLVSDMFKGAATAKGALVIAPERVIVTTPGPDNKKEL